MNIIGYGKATQDMIASFENHIGFALPEDYKQFLREYNGGITSERYGKFYVKELDTMIPLNVLYGLRVDKKQVDLKVWYDEYKEDLFTNCIIIGSDPGSGSIVLINDIEEKGIYFWDQGWYFDQSDEDNNTYKVADSFQTFLDGLKSPDEN